MSCKVGGSIGVSYNIGCDIIFNNNIAFNYYCISFWLTNIKRAFYGL